MRLDEKRLKEHNLLDLRSILTRDVTAMRKESKISRGTYDLIASTTELLGDIRSTPPVKDKQSESDVAVQGPYLHVATTTSSIPKVLPSPKIPSTGELKKKVWLQSMPQSQREQESKTLTKMQKQGVFNTNPRYSKGKDGMYLVMDHVSCAVLPSLQCDVKEVMFTDFDVGQTVTKTIVIRNTSSVSRTISLLPFTDSTSFSAEIELIERGVLVPGMPNICRVHFSATSRRPMKDSLQIMSNDGFILTVPVYSERKHMKIIGLGPQILTK